jgi:hypothetical protein
MVALSLFGIFFLVRNASFGPFIKDSKHQENDVVHKKAAVLDDGGEESLEPKRRAPEWKGYQSKTNAILTCFLFQHSYKFLVDSNAKITTR